MPIAAFRPDAIADFDDAYANAAHIPGGGEWPERWAREAASFRQARADRTTLLIYGEHEREALDLFHPRGAPEGLVVFVHGGYWIRFDRTFFSHLAAGPLAHGWAVALPSYVLAPRQRVGDMGRGLALAVERAAAEIAGPVVLSGHSAGGHLVTRLACNDARLSPELAARVRRVVSISGVHDLRPLLRTALNRTIGLDAEEARAESPALLEPRSGTELLAYVGQAERAEFVRQSELLVNVWRGLGARTGLAVVPDRHHFDVIEALADPRSMLCEALVAGGEDR